MVSTLGITIMHEILLWFGELSPPYDPFGNVVIGFLVEAFQVMS